MKKYIIQSAVIFLAALIAGYFVTFLYQKSAQDMVAELEKSFGFIINLHPILIFLFIFLNNTFKSFLIMLGGIFYGIVPVFFLLVNGYLVGLVIAVVAARDGFWVIFLSLVPHGVLEIPAIVIAAGLGLWLASQFRLSIREKKLLRPALIYALRGYAKILLPMLLAAAIIETFITPLIIDWFS